MDNLFKENWFVFDNPNGKPVTTPSAPEPQAPTAEGLTETKEEGEEEVKANATTERAKEKAKLETIQSLASLKESMKESSDDLKKLDDFINSINIGRLTITADEYLNDDGIRNKIKEKIINKDISTVKPVLEKLFDLNGSNPKDFLSNLVAEALAPKVKEKLDSVKDWNPFKSEEVKMFVKIEKGGETISLDCSNSTEYQKFLDEQVKAEDDAAKAEETQRSAATLSDKQKEIQDSINKHPFGPFILGFISGKPEDGSDSTLTKLAKGTSPVWSFLLGLIGVQQFKGSYDKAKEMAAKNPKSKSIFDRLEIAVKGFVPKSDESSEEAKGSSEAVANYQSVQKATFKDLIDPSKNQTFPIEGVKLSEGFKIPDNKAIEVSGGEVIVDKGDTIYYKKSKDLPNNKKTAEDKPEAIKEDTIFLVGFLPLSTVIKGVSVKTVDV